MNNRLVLIVRLAGLLLVGSLTLPAGAAPGLPLTDPFGVRFTPAPVRVAPMQGLPRRVLHGRGLGWPRFSPDGRFLAFSRTVALVRFPWNPENAIPSHPVDEILLLDVRTGRVSVLLSATQARTSEGSVSRVVWIDRHLLKVSVFYGDDGSTFVTTVHVPSREVVAEDWVLDPSLPTPAQRKARDRARALFPGMDEGFFRDDAWASAALDGDRSVILKKPTRPGGIWLLDLRRRAVRHLVPVKESDAALGDAITVGESTLFLLSQLLPGKSGGKTRLFLYRDDRVEPLIDVGVEPLSDVGVVLAEMSPLLVTRNRVYFLLPWASGSFEVPRAALYSFDLDTRTFQQSNDYPSLFAADIDPSGRLVALAYRTKTENRIVVAELVR